MRSLKAGWWVIWVSLLVSGVSADAVTGTFTGSVAVRGNYYWERSTRVVAPAVTATLESPRGVRVDGTYLVDAITSASQATGVLTDVVFREIRNDVQGGVGYEFNLGKAQLDVSLRGRFSKEPDYRSRGFGFATALSFDQRNSVLRLNGYFVDDLVYAVSRSASTANAGGLVAARPDFKGKLDTLSLGLAWDQALTPLAWLSIGYDLAVMQGFTANPYRQVIFQVVPGTGDTGGIVPEKHPDLRVRQALYGWFAHYVPATRSSVRAGYRVYRDSWDVTAHAPELRLYQELGPHLELRLRYRYYTQTASSFWRRGGNRSSDRYFTADPKMSPFLDHTMGGKLRLALGFLSHTPLHVFRAAVLDLSLEYMINTNRYGNAWISQGGMIWPF
jgi:hypothetical protein